MMAATDGRKMRLTLWVLCLLSFTQAWHTCVPETPLPFAEDCNQLISWIRAVSELPSENVVKRWGLREETTSTSEKLPKIYYLHRPAGRIASTCIIHVDAFERPFCPTYDEFKLIRVVSSSTFLVDDCLIRRGKSGYDFPGANQIVYVRLERALLPPAATVDRSQAGKLYEVLAGDRTAELRVLTGSNAIVIPGSNNITIAQTS